MRCSNCGNELTEGARVCPRCGTRQNLTNSERSVGSGASKKSLGAVFGLVAVIVVVLVVGVLGIAKVTNTSIGSLISGDVKKYNDKYYGYNNLNNSYGGSSSSYNGGGNNNGGGNQDGGFDEKDYERYEYNPETRIIGSKNKKTNKVLTYYDTPIENISVEENEVIYANNELMLTAKKGTDLDTVEKTVAKYGGKVVGINQYVDMYQVQFDKTYNYNELNTLIEIVTKESIFDKGTANVGLVIAGAEEKYYPNDKEYKDVSEYLKVGEINYINKDWFHNEINSFEMWKLLDEQKISICKVGVIDSGIYTEHEDISKNIYKELLDINGKLDYTDNRYKYCTINKSNGDTCVKIENKKYDTLGESHGTHVAGIIGAERDNNVGIAGVGAKVRMFAMPFSGYEKLIDKNKKIKELLPSATYTDYFTQEKERYKIELFAYEIYELTKCIAEQKCRVVNISQYWAIKELLLFQHVQSDFKNLLNALIDEGHDFLIVKAAGNTSEQCTYCSYDERWFFNSDGPPPNWTENINLNKRYQILENITDEKARKRIVVVGASNGKSNSAYFSNYGDRVDIFAPGEKIYSTVYNRFNNIMSDYWYMDGTSMAAPVVTGVIANMFSANPNLKAEEVKDILQKTATKDITDNGGYNHKIINGYEAVKYVIGLNDEEGIIDISSGYVDLGGDKYKVIDKDDKNGKALIVAIDAVDAKPYFVSNTNIETSCTWGTSSLRKWLNEDYYNGVDEKQRNAVLTTIVKDENSFLGLGSTEDKIFILSKSELENYFGKGNNENEYSDVDINRQVVASSKAVSNGAYVGKKDYETNGGKIKLKEGKTIYWVRNQGKDDSTKAMVVNTGGTISTDGVDIKGDFTDVNGDHGKICVRPAMWVRYKSVK